MSPAVKLVGASRGTDPLESLRQDLEDAHAEAGRHDKALEAAQARFDADGSDAHADEVLEARRIAERSRLFVERAQKRLAEANAKAAEAEEAKRRARAEELAAQLTDEAVVTMMAPLAERYLQLLDTGLRGLFSDLEDARSELQRRCRELESLGGGVSRIPQELDHRLRIAIHRRIPERHQVLELAELIERASNQRPQIR